MSQHPSTAPLPTPTVPSVHTMPVTVLEWRIRRECRANSIMLTGIVVFIEATVLRTGLLALLALAVAVALIAASIMLRPTLPWRVPRGAVGSATGTDHEGQPTTGENPMIRDPRSGSSIPAVLAPVPARIDSFPVAAPIGTRAAAPNGHPRSVGTRRA